jgi:hypothetical protein
MRAGLRKYNSRAYFKPTGEIDGYRGKAPDNPIFEVEPMTGIEPATYGLRIHSCHFVTLREHEHHPRHRGTNLHFQGFNKKSE